MFRASHSRGSKADQQLSVMLAPVFLLFALLLPFLLLQTSFAYLGTIKVALPLTKDESEDGSEQHMALHLRVSRHAFEFSPGMTVPSEQQDTLRATIPHQGTTTPSPEKLTPILAKLKGKVPAADTLVFKADDKLTYGQVIELLDAARSSAAQGDAGRLPLFPNLVIDTRD